MFLKSFLHMVTWYQVFLSITNNLQTDLRDGTLTGTTTPGQNEIMSNSNKTTLQKSITGVSPSDIV